jgi:hypothetical protein
MHDDHDDLVTLTAGALAGMDLTYMEPKLAAKAAVDVAREAAHRLVTIDSLQQSATLALHRGRL